MFLYGRNVLKKLLLLGFATKLHTPTLSVVTCDLVKHQKYMAYSLIRKDNDTEDN